MQDSGPIKLRICTVAIFLIVLLFATVPARAHITASTPSASFADQQVGTSSAPIGITLTNTSDRATTLEGISSSASEFSYFGPSLPMVLEAGGSVVVNVVFTPDSAQQFSGVLTVVRDFGPPAQVSLAGAGAAGALNVSSNVLSFGSIGLSASTVQTTTLTNTGNAPLAISNVAIAGAGFSASGVPAGLVLNPGQSTTLNLSFTPADTGVVSGNATITSNAQNSTLVVGLTGTGAVAGTYSATLTWAPSTDSDVVGYNAYSSTVSGGPYTLLDASPIDATTYTDTTVQSGQTYYYVVASVDSNNVEGAYSQEISATIP